MIVYNRVPRVVLGQFTPPGLEQVTKLAKAALAVGARRWYRQYVYRHPREVGVLRLHPKPVLYSGYSVVSLVLLPRILNTRKLSRSY